MKQQSKRRSGLAGGAALVFMLSACVRGGPAPVPRAPTPVEEPRAGEPEEPEPSRESPVVLGVLLSQSGSEYLQQYGALVMQGIELAVDAHQRVGGRPVELRLQDIGTGGATAGAGALAQAGAVAIVGPLLPDAVAAAAAGRGASPIAIVSPSSPEPPSGAGVYSLNAGDTRGAEALARFAVESRFGPIGILHPLTTDGERQARAFTAAIEGAGGSIAQRVPYDSTTTTFAQPMERLAQAGVRAVFVPAHERDIPQIAPQLAYYGLADVQVLGSEAWTNEELLRSLPPRETEGVIAATSVVRTDNAVAWEELVAAYEGRYRRSLNHPFPALGYDAAGIVLAAVRTGADDAGEVAEALGRISGYRGASGVLTVRAGVIEREPFIVRVEAGRLVRLEGPAQP